MFRLLGGIPTSDICIIFLQRIHHLLFEKRLPAASVGNNPSLKSRRLKTKKWHLFEVRFPILIPFSVHGSGQIERDHALKFGLWLKD